MKKIKYILTSLDEYSIFILLVMVTFASLIFGYQSQHQLDSFENELLYNENINQSYLENITEIKFGFLVHACANYDVDTKVITINVNRTNCIFISYSLRHELKHHWCYMHKRDEEIKLEKDCSKKFNQSDDYQACLHTGCFLNTPIDEEYGFVS